MGLQRLDRAPAGVPRYLAISSLALHSTAHHTELPCWHKLCRPRSSLVAHRLPFPTRGGLQGKEAAGRDWAAARTTQQRGAINLSLGTGAQSLALPRARRRPYFSRVPLLSLPWGSSCRTSLIRTSWRCHHPQIAPNLPRTRNGIASKSHGCACCCPPASFPRGQIRNITVCSLLHPVA